MHYSMTEDYVTLANICIYIYNYKIISENLASVEQVSFYNDGFNKLSPLNVTTLFFFSTRHKVLSDVSYSMPCRYVL